MGSAASGPRRATSFLRIPSPSSTPAKNSNGGMKSAALRHFFKSAAAGAKRGTAPACFKSDCHSVPLRCQARSNKSSSLRPNSGLFRTSASARSSSGKVSRSPSDSRSSTAICSDKRIRSAPATAMPAAFRAATMGPANGLRLRTRMRMSPAPMARFSEGRRSPVVSHVLIWAAIFAASRTAGAEAAVSSSGDQASVSGGAS